MKAIVVHEFGPPDVMRIEDIEAPSPGPTDVLVRVRATGVNPVDTYVRAGTAARPALPYVPGMDFAGIVEAVGSQVKGLRAGARVYGSGTPMAGGACAELVVRDQAQVYPLPDGCAFAQGAALGIPYGTAWRALFLVANARPGDTVLVHGASGGAGVAAVQIARAAGLKVIGTAGTAPGLALVTAQGAHHALDHGAPDYLHQVMAITEGRGVNLVLEMLANVNLDRDLDILAPAGQVVVIGNRGRVEIDPRKLMVRDASIHGLLVFNTRPEDLRVIHTGIRAGLETGALRPAVACELPLAEAAAAHARIMEPGAQGKIVLVP
ncbi:MAG: NADPH:quinone reductase [Acidobacteria bacterium]|nr:NADPH:quinone reductase [Acidobacteriota bacterium]